jgi:hypothetical protein
MKWRAVLCVFAVAGCADRDPCATAPRVKSETIPLPPVSEDQLIWQPGHWDWNGSDYSWHEGKYARMEPGQSNMWVPGWWELPKDSRSCVWNPAHWQS